MRNKLKKIKIAAVTCLALLGAMLTAKYYLDKRNLNGIENSFSEIYRDRLLAESYIFELNDLLYRKKILLMQAPSAEHTSQHQEIDKEIGPLLERYEKTRLTAAENVQYLGLKEALRDLLPASHNSAAVQIEACERAIISLRSLSGIQVMEGKQLNESNHRYVSESAAAIQLEWAIYFVTLLVVAALAANRINFSGKIQGHLLN